VGKFAQILYHNLDWLIQNGHPKWQFVDLNFPLKGWEQYDCVQKYLRKPESAELRKTTSEINPIMEAVKDILKP
jgi:hypothetical protein